MKFTNLIRPVLARLLPLALLLTLSGPLAATIGPMQLHVTDNYGAESSSATVGAGGLYTLSIHADNLPNGDLTGVEFKVIVPPGMSYLSFNAVNGGLIIENNKEFSIVFPIPISDGDKVLEIVFLTVTAPGDDQLVELAPITSVPTELLRPSELAGNGPP